VKDEEGFRENDMALDLRLRKGLKKIIVKLYFLLVISPFSKPSFSFSPKPSFLYYKHALSFT